MVLGQVFPVTLFVLMSKSVYYGAILADSVDLEVCNTQVCQESAQFLTDTMDTSVDPCDDFYRYVCGGYIDKHPIPEDEDAVSLFGTLNTEVNENIQQLLTQATKENHPKPILDAANLYQGCIDENARKLEGLEPLKNVLNSFGGWPIINPEWSGAGYQWYIEAAKIKRILGVDAIIAFIVAADESDNTRYIPYLGEPDFGIKTEYLKNLTASETVKKAVNAYQKYITTVAKRMNPNITYAALLKDALDIIQFESDLAQGNYSVGEFITINPWYEELLDSVIHKVIKGSESKAMAVSDVQQLTKNEYFQWKDFINVILQDFPEVTDDTEIIPYDKMYLSHAIKVAQDTDPRIVANYIGWTVVREIGAHTIPVFRYFEYRFKTGVGEEAEYATLDSLCLKETIDLFKFAVGRLYVDNNLPEEVKHDVEELAEDIRSAYEISFIHNDWIDPETKAKALEKLRSMLSVVGYPEWIKDDNELRKYYRLTQRVDKDKYFISWMTVKGAAVARDLMKWNQTWRRESDWHEAPTIVNAFYLPQYNAMMLPAGILHPPFYKYGRLPALNLGAIGFFLAHEIGHGYDNKGSLHDKEGKEVNWWSKETKSKFEEKVACFKDQYSSYVEPTTNMSLNGEGTIGDDIADNGGIRNAYLAYKLKILQSEENEVVRKTRLPGIPATSEQLFFISFATLNCESRSKESMEWFIENEEHSPEEFRIIVPLSNSRAFSEAFNCPVGSRMNPVSKCHLW